MGNEALAKYNKIVTAKRSLGNRRKVQQRCL